VPCQCGGADFALLMDRLNEVAEVRFAAATVLQPASEYGKDALDELHQQTVSLLSFQNMPPRAGIRYPVASNTPLASFGESSTPDAWRGRKDRVRRHYTALAANRLPDLRTARCCMHRFFTANDFFPSALNWSVLFRWQ